MGKEIEVTQIKHDKQTLIDVLYKYYVDIEIKRRQEAVILLEKKEFSKLRNNYIHYLITKSGFKILGSNKLADVIEALACIHDSLPVNSDYHHVYSFYNEDSEEKGLGVEWKEYSIETEGKCGRLAMHWAKDGAFKIEHQPNGKDAKGAIEIYEKYK